MNAEALVLVDRPMPGCAVVTLHRPRVMNALSLALRAELAATFDGLARAGDVRVVVLTGAGKAFCAGVDLKELGASRDPTAAVAPDPAADPVAAIGRFPWPVIGAVNGPAITGGFEVALACDLLIASTHATFADTHARVGVLPGWGLLQKLPRIIGMGRAKELSFTGNFLGAGMACEWGLVNRVVDPHDLLPAALTLAADMLSALPEMLQAYKRLIDDGAGMALADALQLEKARSRRWARQVDAGDIEARRRGVAERGRAQNAQDDS